MSNLNYVWGGLNTWMLIYNYIIAKWENLIFPCIIYPPNNILLTHIVLNFNIKYFLQVLNKLKIKKGDGTTFIYTYLKSYFLKNNSWD